MADLDWLRQLMQGASSLVGKQRTKNVMTPTAHAGFILVPVCTAGAVLTYERSSWLPIVFVALMGVWLVAFLVKDFYFSVKDPELLLDQEIRFKEAVLTSIKSKYGRFTDGDQSIVIGEQGPDARLKEGASPKMKPKEGT